MRNFYLFFFFVLFQWENNDRTNKTFVIIGPKTEDNFFEWEAYIALELFTFFLLNQYKHHLNKKWNFKYNIISGPDGTPFEGGIFPATLIFPKDYPMSPPSMKFSCEMFHPNGF